MVIYPMVPSVNKITKKHNNHPRSTNDDPTYDDLVSFHLQHRGFLMNLCDRILYHDDLIEERLVRRQLPWVSVVQKGMVLHGVKPGSLNTHTIHVWYIYLHLVDFYGKCS